MLYRNNKKVIKAKGGTGFGWGQASEGVPLVDSTTSTANTASTGAATAGAAGTAGTAGDATNAGGGGNSNLEGVQNQQTQKNFGGKALDSLTSNPSVSGAATAVVGLGTDFVSDKMSDNDATTNTKKEQRATIWGSAAKGAAAGALAGVGFMGVGAAVGAVVGGVIGLVSGLFKNKKNKKLAKTAGYTQTNSNYAKTSNSKLQDLMKQSGSPAAPTSATGTPKVAGKNNLGYQSGYTQAARHGAVLNIDSSLVRIKALAANKKKL